MKRALMIGGFWFTMIATILTGCKGMNKTKEYQQSAVISKVCGNEVYLVDNRNEEFSFYGDNYKVGTKVTVTFNDNNTIEIYDDEVLNVAVN